MNEQTAPNEQGPWAITNQPRPQQDSELTPPSQYTSPPPDYYVQYPYLTTEYPPTLMPLTPFSPSAASHGLTYYSGSNVETWPYGHSEPLFLDCGVQDVSLTIPLTAHDYSASLLSVGDSIDCNYLEEFPAAQEEDSPATTDTSTTMSHDCPEKNCSFTCEDVATFRYVVTTLLLPPDPRLQRGSSSLSPQIQNASK
jgi:hypothetical protein